MSCFIKKLYTVDLVKFARFSFSRIFKNIAKINIIIALLKKHDNSRIINFVKVPKIGNSRKLKRAKIYSNISNKSSLLP